MTQTNPYAQQSLANLLQGKVIIVTGGNSGIGKAIVEEVARLGARVALAARVGDKVPLETQRGYHVTVANAGLTVNRMVNWVSRRVFTTPMEMGMRFAGTVEIAGLDTPPHWERADRLLELGRKMYPSMNVSDISRWMGHRPCLPDSLPAVFDRLYGA